MPKEVIYPDTPVDFDEPNAPFAVAVGWQKDCDAQVGIITLGDRHLIDYMLSNDTVDEMIVNMRHLGASAMIAARELHPGIVTDFRTKDEEDRFMFDVGCAISEHLRARYPTWKSLWWYPTRAQINKLILLLRKARDSAYGKDA